LTTALLAGALTTGACGGRSDREHEGHGEHEGHDEREGHDDREGHDEHDEHEEGVIALSPEAAARVSIRVEPAATRGVPFVLRTTARVDYDERRIAHVSPRVPGRVAEVVGELGQDVAVGDKLASLDSIELGAAKADYLAARAEASLARQTLAREQRLLKERITSQQAVSEARATREKALAHLRAAEEKLRLLGIPKEDIEAVRYGDPKAALFPLVAPIAGRIVDKHLVVGELVSPEEKVFTIADLRELWIWTDAYERDVAHVHAEDTVEIRTEAYPDRVFEGRVAYVSDRVDPATRAVRARIDIDNAAGLLKVGMFCDVVLTDPHSVGDREGVALPPAAVTRDGARSVAFVKVGERRYERRVLEVGARTSELVEVVSGVKAGEPVVVEGAFILKSESAKEGMGGGHSH